MPRSNGIFSLVASYFATSGQSIRTEQHNPVLEDIAQAITGSVARDGSAPMLGDLQMGGRKITGLGNGVAATDAAAFGQIPSTATLTALSPAGQIGWFAMPAAPSGWLKANGVAVSRTTYAALFANIGTTWGVGDGSTTFNLPDIRGEFVRALDEGRGVDAGRVFGSMQAAAMLDHTHSGYTSGGGAHSHSGGAVLSGIFSDVGPASQNAHPVVSETGVSGEHNHTVTTGSPSAGGGSETRPRNVALLACIKI